MTPTPYPVPTQIRAGDPRSRTVHLRRGGVSAVFDLSAERLPVVAYWGADLGELDDDTLVALTTGAAPAIVPNDLDVAETVEVLPLASGGWRGLPGVEGRLGERTWWPLFRADAVELGEHTLTVTAVDDAAGITVTIVIELLVSGLLRQRAEVTSGTPESFTLDSLQLSMPVPRRANEVLDLAGRWGHERAPQRLPLSVGTHLRDSRRGRTGTDAALIVAAATAGFGFAEGEVWAIHVAWSGNHRAYAERSSTGTALLGGGELLLPAEITLQTGDSYSSPWLYASYGRGLDEVAARFHGYLRSRTSHPRSIRPVVLNTWEAVYFDHDPANLLHLADVAAGVGIERFVLDDGWFLARRDDTKGLGDWVVDAAVWPDGLGPLAKHVHGLGMEFGLWFEPEMVNLDSDLARAHPDWLLHRPDAIDFPAELSWRTQFVLDIANPAAYAHVLGQMDALVTDLGIDFIKWDHNRDLVEAVHAGRYGVHAQTQAAYRLFAELKGRHPGLEIESCSSGGARSDLGIMAVADRMWASDSNDPVERQDIQRWTQLLLPPELVGGHVGPTVAHSSGRATDLSYRLATSLMGSAGFEWNIAECTAEELATITAFSALYKELRHVIHTGTAVHGDLRDPALRLTGAVLPDRSEAVYTIASVATTEDSLPEHVRLHGLDPAARYTVRVRREIGRTLHGSATPAWLAAGEVTLPGSVLGAVGLQIPPFWPAQALVLHLTRA